MMKIDINKPDWEKVNNMLPAIVQDAHTGQVLMLGFMNQAALEKTVAEKRVTFYSRSKQRLWTKGETSGHYLAVKSIESDCDHDTLLVKALPNGPVCHLGHVSCFANDSASALHFLYNLENIINERIQTPTESSYVCQLLKAGIKRIAQKVGEEGVELSLAAVTDNDNELIDEASDLLFHMMVLLQAKGHSLQAVVDRLAERHK